MIDLDSFIKNGRAAQDAVDEIVADHHAEFLETFKAGRCELNLETSEAGCDRSVAWRATNAEGTTFLLCDPCVAAYRKRRPGPAEHIKFEAWKAGVNGR